MQTWVEERKHLSNVEFTVRKDGLPSMFFSAQSVQAMAVREWENPAECLPLPTKLIASVILTHCDATYFQQVAMFVAMQIKLLSKVDTIAMVITLHTTNSNTDIGARIQRSV
jgi:hypothetical protein